ncbi:MAG: ABC transporter permease [Mycoplasmoidaceae bacterium]|nr:MAG: ABC transporter permease [Mycoplasmoidaceae bacterium]
MEAKRHKYYGFQKSRGPSQGAAKKFALIIPFVIITLLLVILPLVLIFIKSFQPVAGATVADNWNFVDMYIWNKILMSLMIAVVTTIICVFLAYPFCYFLAQTKNQIYKSVLIFIATAPIWTSFLVKLVGLKTFFDACNQFQNSTFGDIWTIIGLVYLYVPFMLAPLYTTMINMPPNLINASYDMGRNGIQTFFAVVIPYTWNALISGIALVFLPSLVTVAVPAFLNNSPNGGMIGDVIVEEGTLATTSEIALARASTLSLILIGVLVGCYLLFCTISGGYKHYKKKGENS